MGAVSPEARPPTFKVPTARLPVSSRHPSELTTGAHRPVVAFCTLSTRVMFGVFATARIWARVNVPRVPTPGFSERVAERVPPCWMRAPEQDLPSVCAVPAGGGETFPLLADVVLSLSAVSPDGAVMVMTLP